MEKRSNANEKAGKLWSLAVRAVRRCALCKVSHHDIRQFDAHHILGRGAPSLKYDLENGACLCRQCHRMVLGDTSHNAEMKFRDVMRKRRPELMESLEAKRKVVRELCIYHEIEVLSNHIRSLDDYQISKLAREWGVLT